MTAPCWPEVDDDATVERLLAAIPRQVIEIYRTGLDDGVEVPVHAGDTANALLFVLATVLEESPLAKTPRDLRLLAEAAGRELHKLMRDTRELKARGQNH